MMTRMDLENSGCHQFMGEAAPGHDVLPKNQYTGPGTLITAGGTIECRVARRFARSRVSQGGHAGLP